MFTVCHQNRPRDKDQESSESPEEETMIYVWEEATEGDTREVVVVLSFDAHQAEKCWEVFLSRENCHGVGVVGWRTRAWRELKSQRGWWLEDKMYWCSLHLFWQDLDVAEGHHVPRDVRVTWHPMPMLTTNFEDRTYAKPGFLGMASRLPLPRLFSLLDPAHLTTAALIFA